MDVDIPFVLFFQFFQRLQIYFNSDCRGFLQVLIEKEELSYISFLGSIT